MTTTTFNAGYEYAEFLTRKRFFHLAAAMAFLMSSYFVVGYLAGNILIWTWDISQWMNGIVGIGITGTMTGFQLILYSQGDVKKASAMTVLATIVAVSFSLLSEVGQGMERDHIRMETKSAQSGTYQAVQQQIANGAGAVGGHPYSAALASAEMKLARCHDNVASGKWKDCVKSTARVKSIKAQIDDYYARAGTATIGLIQESKKLEKDENNYHPLVNLMRDWFAVSGVFGSFMIAFFMIALFEFAFHYLGKAYAYQRDRLVAHGYDVTNKKRIIPNKTKPESLPSSGAESSPPQPQNQPALEHSDTVERVEIQEELPLPSSGVSPRTSTPDTRKPLQGKGGKPFTDDLYEKLKALVKAGQVNPTFRPIKATLKSWEVEGSDNKRQAVAATALDRMFDDGILKLNPENGKGGLNKSKYILA